MKSTSQLANWSGPMLQRRGGRTGIEGLTNLWPFRQDDNDDLYLAFLLLMSLKSMSGVRLYRGWAGFGESCVVS